MLLDISCSVNFMDVIHFLAENNVETRPIWKPMHMQPLYADRPFISVEEKPVNEDIFSRGLCLPSDIKMTEEEQEYVIGLLHKCVK